MLTLKLEILTNILSKQSLRQHDSAKCNIHYTIIATPYKTQLKKYNNTLIQHTQACNDVHMCIHLLDWADKRLRTLLQR